MVENRGPELQAVCSTMVSLSFVSVVLRVYVRTRIVKAFGWDDFFMVFALLFNVMFATCAIGGIHYGTGRHMRDLSDEAILKAMRYWWYCYIAYCWAMITVKTSIGLFLLRVTIKPLHRWIIYIAMGLTVLTGLVFFFVTLLQCAPLSYFWDKSQKGWCIDVDVIIALTFLYSAVSVICDFTFAILPIFLVWNLNMSVKTRIMLIPILGMACVASVAVLCRMAYVMDFKNPDFLWATLDIAIWSDVEQGLAITAGSLATLRPLYRKFAAHFGIDTTGKGESGKGNTPQWYGGPSTAKESKRKSLFHFGTLMKTEKGADKDEDYGMGNLQPMRLRDDLLDENQVEKNEKGFSSWMVSAGDKSFDEEHAVPQLPSGQITLQKDVVQESERRSF
ncbi:hypothetical protein N0V95_008447 [Ascochyta clinopodiicola]|nr:hypothetical protein N0V95_008447 [Ascochyta clinopodiicola]